MALLIQPSFAKGEIGSSLYGRVDTAMYRVGLRRAHNCIIHTYGGISNKAGTLCVGPCKEHLTTVRPIPFHVSDTDQYMLEFGELYMRVVRNDGHVLNTATNITAIHLENPVRIVAAAHGISAGEEVFLTGIVGTTQLNGRRFTVGSVTTNDLTLLDQIDGLPIDGTSYTAWTSGGTVASVFTLTTPYAATDLPEIRHRQRGDTMTLTHDGYAPRDLVRTDHNVWAINDGNTYAPSLADPTGAAVAAQGSTASTTQRYQVTAITTQPLEESLPAVESGSDVLESATAANPVVATATGHSFQNGDEIEITDCDEMTELNGRRFIVANQATNTIELLGEDGTGRTAESTGGVIRKCFVELTNAVDAQDTTSANFNRVSWTAVTGANKYAIYRRENGIYGLIGETELAQFDDVKNAKIIPADLDVAPPKARNPFLLTGNFPRAVGDHQQREVYAGTTNDLDTWFASQTGNRTNMSVSQPRQSDDAITVTLPTSTGESILHVLSFKDLLLFTTAGEWSVSQGGDTYFDVDTIRQTPQSDWGSSYIAPWRVGSTIMFVEAGRARLRSLGFQLDVDGYPSDDLTLLANHLFANDSPTEHLMVAAAMAQFPEPRAHIVRSDGNLATMTFDKAQEVVAWTTWSTEGVYKDVARLRRSLSSVEDGVYYVVRRFLNGRTVQFIERGHSRKFADVRDGVFLDCSLSVDDPKAICGVETGATTILDIEDHGFSPKDLIDIDVIRWKEPTRRSSVLLQDKFDRVQPQHLNKTRPSVKTTNGNKVRIAQERFEFGELTGRTQDFSVLTEAGGRFNDGGTKFYLVDNTVADATITQYNVATAFDVSTANLTSGTVTVTTGFSFQFATGVAFGLSGTRMYIASVGDDLIQQYDLTTGYDLSTATLAKTQTMSGFTDGSSITGLGFEISLDGTKIYFTDASDAEGVSPLYQVSLDVAFEIDSLNTGTVIEFNPYATLGSQKGFYGIAWEDSGHYFYTVENGEDDGTAHFWLLQEYYAPGAFNIQNAIATTGTFLLTGGALDGDSQATLGIGNINSSVDSDGQIFLTANVINADGTTSAVRTWTVPVLEDIDSSDFAEFDTLAPCGEARLTFTTVTGAWIYEGETVDALVDGVPATLAIENGSATVSRASRVHLGLGYTSDIETLDIEAPRETIQGKRIKVPSVGIRVERSVLPWIGPGFSKDNDPTQIPPFTEMFHREYEDMGQPDQLRSGIFHQTLYPEWNSNGRVALRQIEPLPLTVLSVIPDIMTGDDDD